MITANAIFTKLYHALNDGGESVYCTTSHDALAPSLPCMYFRETHMRPNASVTLGYDDEVIRSTIYIELFGKDDLKKLVRKVEDAMRGMYYIEDSCVQVDNADVSIDRYALTFSRIICEGDTLDEESDNG